jgi:hypothetical protein
VQRENKNEIKTLLTRPTSLEMLKKGIITSYPLSPCTRGDPKLNHYPKCRTTKTLPCNISASPGFSAFGL